MSRLGRVTYRESGRSPFFGGSSDWPRERSHSEQTAREIDIEVKRIIDESLVKVRHIIEVRRESLEAMAKRLIEKEVIDADELKQIIDETSRSPVIVPGTIGGRKRSTPASEPAEEKPDVNQAEGG